MRDTPYRTPALLVVLDGYGLAEPSPTNAISQADTPNLDRYLLSCPVARLDSSGTAVGLPEGQMGNSEVGHLNIGAGRVVYQELTRIDLAIEDGSFFENAALTEAFDAAKDGHTLHLMGLVSDGGVHSHIEHLKALIQGAIKQGVATIRIHAFLDGRDVSPTSGAGFIQELQEFIDHSSKVSDVRVSSIMGRYFAMDRDNRWDRIEAAFDAIVCGRASRHADDPVQAVETSYERGLTDEFVEPCIIGEASPVTDGDAVVFMNFRPDRARELTRAFTEATFTGFSRSRRPEVTFVTLTDYDPELDVLVAFPKELPKNVLADVLASHGLRQYHIAETEKYAHVTFFFNGGDETPKEGEERVLIPSPKVATYDLQPEMSAPEVASTLAAAIEADRADVYIVNFANCDMVGHTGDLDAAIKAVEAVDEAVGEVVEKVVAKGGFALITADHGNAEQMVESSGSGAFTAHTLSKVPLILVDRARPDKPTLAERGILADVAPTLLAYMGIDIPPSWTGRSLLL